MALKFDFWFSGVVFQTVLVSGISEIVAGLREVVTWLRTLFHFTGFASPRALGNHVRSDGLREFIEEFILLLREGAWAMAIRN